MNEEKTVKEKVEEISIRTFTIGSCPEHVFQRFKKYCEVNAKNVRYYQDKTGVKTKEEIIYHIGLSKLLDTAEADAKSMMLFQRIVTLEERFDFFEDRFKEKPKEKKERKTFGNK